VGVEVFDGFEAHGGDVGAAVVAGAGAFAEGPTRVFAEGAGALDHAVGALDGLDGEGVAAADGDGLADVEAKDLGEERPGEGDVGALLGGGVDLAHDAGGGHLFGDGGGGVEELDAVAAEFFGDGVEEDGRAAVVAEVLVPGFHGADVGEIADDFPGVIEEFGLVDAADHDGVVDTEVSEGATPGADAEDADGLERGAEGGEDWVELIDEPEAVDGVAEVAECLGDDDGESAAAGDEADGGGRRRRIGEDGEGGGHGAGSDGGARQGV